MFKSRKKGNVISIYYGSHYLTSYLKFFCYKSRTSYIK